VWVGRRCPGHTAVVLVHSSLRHFTFGLSVQSCKSPEQLLPYLNNHLINSDVLKLYEVQLPPFIFLGLFKTSHYRAYNCLAPSWQYLICVSSLASLMTARSILYPAEQIKQTWEKNSPKATSAACLETVLCSLMNQLLKIFSIDMYTRNWAT